MQSVRPAVDTITFDTKEIPMSILKPILILPATLWGALALGGCQQPHSHEHLNGTWKGTSHSINSSGRSHTTKYLVLEVDEKGLIEGTSGWTLLEGPGGTEGVTPRERPRLGDLQADDSGFGGRWQPPRDGGSEGEDGGRSHRHGSTLHARRPVRHALVHVHGQTLHGSAQDRNLWLSLGVVNASSAT